MKIEALIFDLGGIVFDYSFDPVYDTWAVATGKSASDIRERLCFADDFERFERGDITPEQFIAAVSVQLEHQFDSALFVRGWNAIYQDVRPGIEPCLPAWQADIVL